MNVKENGVYEITTFISGVKDLVHREQEIEMEE